MADDFFPIAVPVEIIKVATTPSAPASGYVLIYSKSDNNIYVQTSAGVETMIGSGASSSRTFAYFGG